jgi:virulence factor
VLSDDEISGIFICADPNAHFNLVKKCLQANKHTFVEKPPCSNLKELESLIEIEKASKASCLVGFQKQYAPGYTLLKNKTSGQCSYNYRFVMGMYPEGDPILDLFSHPLSLIVFLFGSVRSSNISMSSSSNENLTIFLQLTHNNDTLGSIELSTDYSWKNANEHLIINTKKGIYEIKNTDEVIFSPKEKSIFKIPKEKIFNTPNASITLKQRNNFNPILENNQLYSSGYFSEIESFVKICNTENSINNSSLSSCLGLYTLINAIKKEI